MRTGLVAPRRRTRPQVAMAMRTALRLNYYSDLLVRSAGRALGDVVARKSAGQPYVTAVAPRQCFPDLFAAGRALCCCELTDPVPPRAHEKLLYPHSSLRDVLARATC